MKSTHTKTRKKQLSLVPPISDIFDWNKTSEEILRHCLGELRAESGSLLLMEEDNESLQLVKAVGTRRNRHCGRIVRLGEGISGYVAANREPLLVTDLSKAKGLTSRKDRYPVDTFMSCPVLKGAAVLGVINVAGRKSGRPFSKRELKKLQAISEGCADVLGQMIAYQRPFKANERLVRETEKTQESLDDIERQLREIKNYNANILRCLSQYVLIFDRQFNITYCSRETDLGRLLGRGAEAQIPALSILDLPFDVERNKLKERLEALLLGGKPFSLNDVKVTNSPEFRIVNMFFSPFASTEGELLGGLLLVEDNTKNYDMRQRLLEAEKFSLIGSLTSMITHEVNNPLDGVMRLINLSLAQAGEDDPVREYLGEAQKGLNRIASLVRSLLSFSRKSASFDGEFTSLNTVIDSAVKVVRGRHEGKDISLRLKLASESPTVRTNDFYQIVGNLLSNSFDAVKPERGNVGIETKMDSDSLHITVHDDGCGIPKHVQSRIFDTFWTTKEYGRGTGLGLAIMKKMVDKYGGKIEVESEEDVGTRTHLTFPLSKLTP